MSGRDEVKKVELVKWRHDHFPSFPLPTPRPNKAVIPVAPSIVNWSSAQHSASSHCSPTVFHLAPPPYLSEAVPSAFLMGSNGGTNTPGPALSFYTTQPTQGPSHGRIFAYSSAQLGPTKSSY